MRRHFLPLILLASVLTTSLSAVPSTAAGIFRQKSSPAPAGVTFRFDEREDGDGNPHTKVFLAVGDRRVLLRETTGKFSALDKSDYKSHHVPAAAVAACTGWWAGSGEDLYVLRRNRSLIVYSRTLDEQAPVGAYRRLKVIPLS